MSVALDYETIGVVARVVARTPFLFRLRRRALREHADRWDAVRARPRPAGQGAGEPSPLARREAERARHEREAQVAFRDGRYADVLAAVAAAEERRPLSELSKRYRSLARKRLDGG